MPVALPILATRPSPVPAQPVLPQDGPPSLTGRPAQEALPPVVVAEPSLADRAAMSDTSIVDLVPLRQALLREAGPRARPADIDQALFDLLDSEFRDARVLIYLPIFLLRAARARLGLGQR